MVAALAPRFAQSPAEAAVTPLPKLFTHVAKSVAPLSQAIWAFPSRSRILCTDPVHYGPSLTALQPRLVHQFFGYATASTTRRVDATGNIASRLPQNEQLELRATGPAELRRFGLSMFRSPRLHERATTPHPPHALSFLR